MTPDDAIRANAVVAADRDRFAEMKRKWGDDRAEVLLELSNVYNVAAYVCPPLREVFEGLIAGVCAAFDLPKGSEETVLPGDRRDFVRDCMRIAEGRMFKAEDGDGEGGVELVRTHARRRRPVET